MANIMYGNDILHYKQLGLIPRWSVDVTSENNLYNVPCWQNKGQNSCDDVKRCRTIEQSFEQWHIYLP